MPRRNKSTRTSPRRQAAHLSTSAVLGTSLRAQRKATSRRAICETGVVAYARVPFVDQPERYKVRPVIVLSWALDGETVEARPLTTRLNSDRENVLLHYWEHAGLSRPCAATPRIVRISRLEFHGVLGRLHPGDAKSLGVERPLVR
jgi:hypothetical protein